MIQFNKNTLKFIHYGGLNPVRQRDHDCPTKKGLYAFPYPLFDKWFLSADYNNVREKYSKSKYVKDHKGNVITEDHSLWEKYLREELPWKYISKYKWTEQVHGKVDIHEGKNGKACLVTLKKPRIFQHYGDIWTRINPYDYKFHMFVLKTHIHDESGDENWWKVDFDTYVCLMRRYIHCLNRDKIEKDELLDNNISWSRYWAIDSFEVFIERINNRRRIA